MEALAYASAWGRLAIVWLLLEYADGRHTGDMSEALYRACSYGHAEIVRVLLLAGADHTRITEGQTARQEAEAKGYHQCVTVLQWWEGELRRPCVLHKARALHDDTARRRHTPGAAVPIYMRPRAASGRVMPTVQVVPIQEDEGGEEMHAMVRYVVRDLASELYVELMAAFHLDAAYAEEAEEEDEEEEEDSEEEEESEDEDEGDED